MSTSDPFALVLHFYAQFQRTKLNKTDLDRIVKKYQVKPKNLLTDLSSKYNYWTIPTTVSIVTIKKYLTIYEIPIGYQNVMLRDLELKKALQSVEYDPRLDTSNELFDPVELLRQSSSLTEIGTTGLVISCNHNQCLDNISRISTILKPHTEQVGVEERPVDSSSYDERYDTQDTVSLINRDFISTYLLHDLKAAPPLKHLTTSGSKAQGAVRSSGEEIKIPAETRRQHIFETIADYSTPSLSVRNDKGETFELDSPLILLKQFMMNKERVRVILRRKTSIRGHLDGFIRAFDKHFNMLMYDVDEEYITNKQKKRLTGFGKFLNQHQVLHRHLPQLIVRGDIVVTVFRVPRSPLLLPVADLSLDQSVNIGNCVQSIIGKKK